MGDSNSYYAKYYKSLFKGGLGLRMSKGNECYNGYVCSKRCYGEKLCYLPNDVYMARVTDRKITECPKDDIPIYMDISEFQMAKVTDVVITNGLEISKKGLEERGYRDLLYISKKDIESAPSIQGTDKIVNTVFALNTFAEAGSGKKIALEDVFEDYDISTIVQILEPFLNWASLCGVKGVILIRETLTIEERISLAPILEEGCKFDFWKQDLEVEGNGGNK